MSKFLPEQRSRQVTGTWKGPGNLTSACDGRVQASFVGRDPCSGPSAFDYRAPALGPAVAPGRGSRGSSDAF